MLFYLIGGRAEVKYLNFTFFFAVGRRFILIEMRDRYAMLKLNGIALAA